MKRLQNQGKALAIAAAIGFSALSPRGALAEDRPVVSARAGQRPPRAMPAASAEGIRLSLDQAIGLALANNQDLNVTINAAGGTVPDASDTVKGISKLSCQSNHS